MYRNGLFAPAGGCPGIQLCAGENCRPIYFKGRNRFWSGPPCQSGAGTGQRNDHRFGGVGYVQLILIGIKRSVRLGPIVQLHIVDAGGKIDRIQFRYVFYRLHPADILPGDRKLAVQRGSAVWQQESHRLAGISGKFLRGILQVCIQIDNPFTTPMEYRCMRVCVGVQLNRQIYVCAGGRCMRIGVYNMWRSVCIDQPCVCIPHNACTAEGRIIEAQFHLSIKISQVHIRAVL